jgi:hypothetical protein
MKCFLMAHYSVYFLRGFERNDGIAIAGDRRPGHDLNRDAVADSWVGHRPTGHVAGNCQCRTGPQSAARTANPSMAELS